MKKNSKQPKTRNQYHQTHQINPQFKQTFLELKKNYLKNKIKMKKYKKLSKLSKMNKKSMKIKNKQSEQIIKKRKYTKKTKTIKKQIQNKRKIKRKINKGNKKQKPIKQQNNLDIKNNLINNIQVQQNGGKLKKVRKLHKLSQSNIKSNQNKLSTKKSMVKSKSKQKLNQVSNQAKKNNKGKKKIKIEQIAQPLPNISQNNQVPKVFKKKGRPKKSQKPKQQQINLEHKKILQQILQNTIKFCKIKNEKQFYQLFGRIKLFIKQSYHYGDLSSKLPYQPSSEELEQLGVMIARNIRLQQSQIVVNSVQFNHQPNMMALH